MEKRFIVDCMLGNVARYLRILGYDTLYEIDISDDEIIEKAKKEDRIIITKDNLLWKKALSDGANAFLVKKSYSNTKDILCELKKNGLISLKFSPHNSRCPLCNGKLMISINQPLLKIHKNSEMRVYFVCQSCGNIYWIGKHFKNILKTLEDAEYEANRT
ncbi:MULTISPECIES: Mut7-C RNAse domain-containing protein [Fervidicoccus]|jgi:uncharacterized protein with PIN domain|uniref:Mut7-C RNAse domain-containing protein n=2 Tax=Fervidicoccus fontis TaxID=683846 RepID=H9ZZY4_FERFK|nr:Mut7-C RNAse domain-containing protein [Fervidicoccus fontis]AFH42291.1 hypothetical protein FFONT_0301 [Fervidicoccus fontis Kam940]PMB76745.1 MAG: YaiI/YqxD family protein [Fervidicoccus fontis]HEW63820.1 hypothetical protein [Fervidicoccus fontis]